MERSSLPRTLRLAGSQGALSPPPLLLISISSQLAPVTQQHLHAKDTKTHRTKLSPQTSQEHKEVNVTYKTCDKRYTYTKE